MTQITKHLKTSSLIGHSHHRAIKKKSTQTMVNEIYDNLLETCDKGDKSALVMLDQSKAYEIINHLILLDKLRAICFTNQATEFMKSFLSERKQYVKINGKISETLLTGPQSVVQGSSLSCVLFLIFVLNLPEIFHKTKHDPTEQVKCNQPNTKTFIDDIGIIISKQKDNDINTLHNMISSAMKKVSKYTTDNKLALNKDKSAIVIVSTKII